MLEDIFNVTLIASTIRLSTPLVLAALGGLYSERGGVINIALEGIMLAGAFTAATVTYFAQSAWVGLLAAIVSGMLVAAIHGAATIRYQADQVVSGMFRPPQVPAAGSACSTRSCGPRPSTVPQYQPCGTALRCVIMAPLGKDVVPEV